MFIPGLEALGAVTIFQTASFPVPDPTKITTYTLNGEYAAVSLTIPAGAWPAGAPGPTLTVFDEASLRRRRAGGAEGAVLAGRAVSFGPEGVKFNKPVSISLPFDQKSDYGTRKLYVHKYATYPNGSQWEIRPYSLSVVQPINTNLGTVTADTPSFSAYAVLALPPDIPQVTVLEAVTTTPVPTTTPKPTGSSLEVYWIIVGLVAPVLFLGVPTYLWVSYRIRQERVRKKEEKEKKAEEEAAKAAKAQKKKEQHDEYEEEDDADKAPPGPLIKEPAAAAAAPLAVEPAPSLLQAGSVRGELVFDRKASSLLLRDLATVGKEKGGGNEAGDDARSADSQQKSSRPNGGDDQVEIAPVPKARSRKGVRAVASHRYVAQSSDELSFEKGSVLTIVGDGDDEGWLQAIDAGGKKGCVPLSRLHHSKGPSAEVTTLPTQPPSVFAVPASPAVAELKAQDSSEGKVNHEEAVAEGGGGGAADLVLGPRIV